MSNTNTNEGMTQIGLHSIKNMLGTEMQLSLFSEYTQDNRSKSLNKTFIGKIDKFGIELTDVQSKIMEGILRGFSETGYKGNLEPIDKSQITYEKSFNGELPSIYKYITEIPRLKATQAQIMEWACVKKNSIAEKERAVEALNQLCTTQYCFYYNRLAYDVNGIPEKDKKGRWKKEEVMAVDTLFSVKEIREEKSSNLKYYEIEISPIFLDQRESYFMLIPYNWREEVREIVGNKKASSYTFRFLLFLRYQYEMKRRSSKIKPPFTLKWTWEEIAVAIKMPESVYKRQKIRATEILENAYSVAKQLGYLSEYKRGMNADILIFNTEKYCPLNNLVEIVTNPEDFFSTDTEFLFELFHGEKKIIDQGHKEPVGILKNNDMQEIETLLQARSKEEVISVIKWGLNCKYWCTRLGTPTKLNKYFGEAVSEMKNSLSLPNNEEERVSENKKMALEFSLKPKKSTTKIQMEVLSSYVEVGNGINQTTCISYKEKGFKDQLENALRKYGI